MGVEGFEFGQELGGGGIGDGDVGDFLVFVDGKVVGVGGDVGFGHEEALGGAGAVGLGVQVGEALKDVRDVVLLDWITFVVEGESVGAHIVEPDLVGAAGGGFGEDEDGGGDAGVRLEDAGGHGDDGAEGVVFHKGLAECAVGLGGAEEHAVRDDTGATAAEFEQAQEEGDKEQLGFLGVGDGPQVGADGLHVHVAFERRVGEADGEGVLEGALLGDAVLVGNLGVADTMKHQVHGGNAQHGAVHVEAGEERPFEVAPLRLGHGLGVVGAHPFGGGDEEAGGAAGGVADGVVRRRRDECDHQFADVLGRAELAVASGGGQLAEHILIEVAADILVAQVMFVEFVQTGDELLEHLRRGNQEDGVFHVAGEGGLRLAGRLGGGEIGRCWVRQGTTVHSLDGGEDAVAHDGEHLTRVAVLEAAPAHRLPRR